MVIEKFNRLESALKNSCTQGLMSSACTPILMGIATLVSEVLLSLFSFKFPLGSLTLNIIIQLTL